MNFDYKDKKVSRVSYFDNAIPYTWKYGVYIESRECFYFMIYIFNQVLSVHIYIQSDPSKIDRRIW